MTRARRSRHLVCVVGALALLLVACTDTERGEPESVPAVEPVGVDFSGRGPYPVGTIDLQMGDRNVVVFYPADEAAVAGTEHVHTHSSDAGLPADARAFVPPALVHEIAGDAYIGPAVNLEGPFPLVVYSHALGQGNRSAAAQLEHLASWGFIAAAPQHRERDVLALAGGQVSVAGDPDVRDLRNTVELMRQENTRTDGVLLGSIDLDHIGAMGHAEGGRAAGRLAMETADIDTWIGQAPLPPVPLTAENQLDLSDGAVAFALAATPPPPQPSLIMAAASDAAAIRLVTATSDWLGDNRQFVLLDNAGNASFTDGCDAVRSRGGLTQYALFLPVPPEALVVLEDGCTEGKLDPVVAARLMRHLEVAHLRRAFAFDETGASLAPAFIDERFGDAVA